MINHQVLHLSMKEVCQMADITTEALIEIVEQGIVDASGEAPESWSFGARAVSIAKKAVRLHNDLDIDWAGIALALELLDEMEQLRAENKMLKQRLDRFILK